MNNFTAVVTALLTSVSLMIATLICTTTNASAQCTPSLATMRTHFPTEATEKRQFGVVRLGIRVDEQGAVVATRVIESSGHATLDSSAMSDIRRHWKFQIGQCTANELAQEREILVTYRRPVGTTVSGTLNRTALARMRQLQANQGCHATRESNDLTLFVCREALKDLHADTIR